MSLWASQEVKDYYNIDLTDEVSGEYDIVIHAVPHKAFKNIDLSEILNGQSIVIDIKSVLDKNSIEEAGHIYWSL